MTNGRSSGPTAASRATTCTWRTGARAYLQLAERLGARPELAGEAFNFSNEQQLTVLELVASILTAMGSRLEPDVRNEASNEIRDQYLDATKARTELAWTPAFTLDQGLRRTVDWYQGVFTHVSRERTPVVILCGGAGTRLAEQTEVRPKPLVEIGGRPILWHIMKHYARYGFSEFVLALGHRGDQIKRYFLDYHAVGRDMTISLQDGHVTPLRATAWSRGRFTWWTPARPR